MARVSFVIKGEKDSVSLRTFVSAVRNFFAILDDLDSAISGQPDGSLDWYVTGLSTEQSLGVEAESRSRLEDKNYGGQVAKAAVSAMDSLERRGASPPYLSEQGMNTAKKLLRLIGRNGAFGFQVSDKSKTVEVTAKSSAAIDQLLPASHTSVGSVEGRLEMVSIHEKPRFIVYQAHTQKAVTCKFDPKALLDRIKEALGKKVRVSGLVHKNAKGEPVRVDLEEIRILRSENELPTTKEIGGIDPDFTGNMTTEDFIKDIRG